MAGDKK
jgi:hypothetical protein